MRLAIPAWRINYAVFSLVLVVFSFTEISLFQVGKAPITPFHLLALGISIPVLFMYPALLKIDKALLLLAGYICVVNALNPAGVRLTSFLYTMVFFFEFVILLSMLRNMPASYLRKAFQLIIILYLINICITWVLILSGLYNEGLSFIFRSYFGMRPMGFSSEPSYAAFIVTVAFICYNELKYAATGKNSFGTLVLFILAVSLSTSAYGLIYVTLCMAYIMFRYAIHMPYRFRLIFFTVVITVSLAVIGYLSTIPSGPIQRLFSLTSAVISDKPLSEKLDVISDLDASAWTRIGPTWMMFQETGSIKGILFGHGSGTSGPFFFEQLAGILVDPDRGFVDLGIIPGFIYDFGLIGFIIFIVFLFRMIGQRPLYMILIALFFFNAGINTQIMWFAILSFSVTILSCNKIKNVYDSRLLT